MTRNPLKAGIPTMDRPTVSDEPEVPAPRRGRKSERLAVRIGGSDEEGHQVRAHPDSLQKIFRTSDEFEAQAFLGQCLQVLSSHEAGGAGEVNDARLFMLSIVNDIGARDAVERMLAVQMAATHIAMIRSGKSLAVCTQLKQLDAHSTNFNKLARTFATQMEALRKHRTGGQQKVVVEHVHVHAGGQAIVGAVHHGGRGAEDEK